MTTDAVGGVWQYSIDLSRELASMGVEVLLVCLGPEPAGHQLRELNGARFMAAPFSLEWTENPWASIEKARAWLIRLEREFKPDIIHLNSYSLAAADWNAPVVCVAHSCVYSWWRAVHQCAPGAEWQEYRKQVCRGLREAEAVVAPSRAMLDCLLSEYGFEPEKGHTIPNFSSAFPPRASKEAFFLAVGRMWDKSKNLALLEAVAPQLTWPLHMAGNGTPLGALPHDEVLKRMAAASIFVHPAFYEPFGLAVLEAARARCCLVLADIPSLRELWQDAAVFVDPRNAPAWAAALNRLAENHAERGELANRAFLVAQRFSAARSVAMYRRLYDRISTVRAAA